MIKNTRILILGLHNWSHTKRDCHSERILQCVWSSKHNNKPIFCSDLFYSCIWMSIWWVWYMALITVIMQKEIAIPRAYYSVCVWPCKHNHKPIFCSDLFYWSIWMSIWWFWYMALITGLIQMMRKKVYKCYWEKYCFSVSTFMSGHKTHCVCLLHSDDQFIFSEWFKEERLLLQKEI